MAKQCGSKPFTGKLGGTVGYKVGDEYLERENGSKEGKAFRKDRRRWRTMYYAGLFAQASKAVVLIYRRLPEDQRKHGGYGKLTGKAMSMIKEGKTAEEVKAVLTKLHVEDKEPLVVVKEQVISNGEEVNCKGEAVGENRPVATGRAVHEPALVHGGEYHVVMTIVRPYFYSTVSVGG